MGFSLSFLTDAEPPPLRPSPPSWNLHVGGLPWPEEVDGQRDQGFKKPAGESTGGLFTFQSKITIKIRKT
jgi:hypothetical protein